jgi:3-hydroxyacyl-CoA dehydrogenase/3-hydroxy-2-methylbutyryl-CoA dehydrogenase
MQVSGKTAVITGGASGLGEAAARHLYSLGANIVIADLNDERGQQLKSELGHKAIYVKTDVSSSEASRALGQAAVDKFGAVHILVNSAGIGTIARIIGKKGPMDVNIFKKTIDVNLIGTFNCMSNLAWEMSKNETVENGERGGNYQCGFDSWVRRANRANRLCCFQSRNHWHDHYSRPGSVFSWH